MNQEDVHSVFGHCWNCNSQIDLVSSRKIRIASIENHPESLEGAVCNNADCITWADQQDSILGVPSKPPWPERVNIPSFRVHI